MGLIGGAEGPVEFCMSVEFLKLCHVVVPGRIKLF